MRYLPSYITRSLLSTFLVCSLAASLSGCVPMQNRILDSEQSQVQLRQIQSRAFDTTEREKLLRTIIATLQDLSFVVDKADLGLGTVSATKLDGYALRMTVSTRPRGNTQTIVRANAQFNNRPVTDPQPYQQFFIALERAMFLTAHSVD
jgi:hypothetical protein